MHHGDHTELFHGSVPSSACFRLIDVENFNLRGQGTFAIPSKRRQSGSLQSRNRVIKVLANIAERDMNKFASEYIYIYI